MVHHVSLSEDSALEGLTPRHGESRAGSCNSSKAHTPSQGGVEEEACVRPSLMRSSAKRSRGTDTAHVARCGDDNGLNIFADNANPVLRLASWDLEDLDGGDLDLDSDELADSHSCPQTTDPVAGPEYSPTQYTRGPWYDAALSEQLGTTVETFTPAPPASPSPPSAPVPEPASSSTANRTVAEGTLHQEVADDDQKLRSQRVATATADQAAERERGPLSHAETLSASVKFLMTTRNVQQDEEISMEQALPMVHDARACAGGHCVISHTHVRTHERTHTHMIWGVHATQNPKNQTQSAPSTHSQLMESGFSEAACKEIMKEVLEQTGSVPASPEPALSSAPAPAEPAWTRADLTTCGEESDDSERVVTPQSPLSPSRSGDRFANHSHARAPIAHELIINHHHHHHHHMKEVVQADLVHADNVPVTLPRSSPFRLSSPSPSSQSSLPLHSSPRRSEAVSASMLSRANSKRSLSGRGLCTLHVTGDGAGWGSGEGLVIEVTHTPFVIGRSRASDWFIPDNKISAKHAILHYFPAASETARNSEGMGGRHVATGGHFELQDMSSFGTFVNGSRILSKSQVVIDDQALVMLTMHHVFRIHIKQGGFDGGEQHGDNAGEAEMGEPASVPPLSPAASLHSNASQSLSPSRGDSVSGACVMAEAERAMNLLDHFIMQASSVNGSLAGSSQLGQGSDRGLGDPSVPELRLDGLSPQKGSHRPHSVVAWKGLGGPSQEDSHKDNQVKDGPREDRVAAQVDWRHHARSPASSLEIFAPNMSPRAAEPLVKRTHPPGSGSSPSVELPQLTSGEDALTAKSSAGPNAMQLALRRLTLGESRGRHGERELDAEHLYLQRLDDLQKTPTSGASASRSHPGSGEDADFYLRHLGKMRKTPSSRTGSAPSPSSAEGDRKRLRHSMSSLSSSRDSSFLLSMDRRSWGGEPAHGLATTGRPLSEPGVINDMLPAASIEAYWEKAEAMRQANARAQSNAVPQGREQRPVDRRRGKLYTWADAFDRPPSHPGSHSDSGASDVRRSAASGAGVWGQDGEHSLGAQRSSEVSQPCPAFSTPALPRQEGLVSPAPAGSRVTPDCEEIQVQNGWVRGRAQHARDGTRGPRLDVGRVFSIAEDGSIFLNQSPGRGARRLGEGIKNSAVVMESRCQCRQKFELSTASAVTGWKRWLMGTATRVSTGWWQPCHLQLTLEPSLLTIRCESSALVPMQLNLEFWEVSPSTSSPGRLSLAPRLSGAGVADSPDRPRAQEGQSVSRRRKPTHGGGAYQLSPFGKLVRLLGRRRSPAKPAPVADDIVATPQHRMPAERDGAAVLWSYTPGQASSMEHEDEDTPTEASPGCLAAFATHRNVPSNGSLRSNMPTSASPSLAVAGNVTPAPAVRRIDIEVEGGESGRRAWISSLSSAMHLALASASSIPPPLEGRHQAS